MNKILNMIYGEENEDEGVVQNEQVKVVLIKPNSFDDVQNIGQIIKDNSSVILNTENLKKEDAVRVIDYLSGLVFALDGTVVKSSSSSFVVTPNNVSVTSDFYDF